MASDDHAIVIGVSRYPHLGDLEGPENDADAVIDWLKDPDGGDVPETHIHPVTSSLFGEPPRPGSDDVYDAFDPVVKLAEQMDPRPAGRRLYIFMAGHGLGPSLREATLLMANAAPKRLGHNVSGGRLADHFVQARYFREVVLLMDCCRSEHPTLPIGVVPWDPVRRASGERTRWFYAFATGYSGRAKERPHEGRIRGLFTVALLEALRSGANSSDVPKLVRRRLIELVDRDEFEDPEFLNSEAELQFAGEPELATLVITLGAAERDVLVTITFGPVQEEVYSQRLAPGGSFERELRPGIYEIRRDDGAPAVTVGLVAGRKHERI